jgi:hypothetical protein
MDNASKKDLVPPLNLNKAGKKFKGNEFAIPIYTPRSAYNFIRQNGNSW